MDLACRGRTPQKNVMCSIHDMVAKELETVRNFETKKSYQQRLYAMIQNLIAPGRASLGYSAAADKKTKAHRPEACELATRRRIKKMKHSNIKCSSIRHPGHPDTEQPTTMRKDESSGHQAPSHKKIKMSREPFQTINKKTFTHKIFRAMAGQHVCEAWFVQVA